MTTLWTWTEVNDEDIRDGLGSGEDHVPRVLYQTRDEAQAAVDKYLWEMHEQTGDEPPKLEWHEDVGELQADVEHGYFFRVIKMELIDAKPVIPTEVRAWLEKKRNQLREYVERIGWPENNESKKYARAVAEGRVTQIDQILAEFPEVPQ